MKRWMMKIVLIILLGVMLPVGVVAYARYIEPKRLVEEEYQIQINHSKQGKNLKIIQFSDVHLGAFYTLENLEKLVRKINRQEPDLVVFTGDLMDNPASYNERGKIHEVLGQIESKYGKFAVWGNHDYGGAGVKFYERIMKDSGFTLLTNEHVSVQLSSGQVMNVIGLDDGLLGNPDSKAAFRGMKPSDFNLLMMHEPDLIEEVDLEKVALVLAGHSHGGQIQMPFKGPLVTPPLASVYTEGLYRLEGERYLYVNSGVGTTKIPIRFLVPPQIAIFEVEL